MKCVDHLGNKFKSRREMCKHYNITPKTLNARLDKGFALCDALTMPYRMRGRYVIWGNEFGSIKQACEYYHVPYDATRQKVYRGEDLADLVLLAP